MIVKEKTSRVLFVFLNSIYTISNKNIPGHLSGFSFSALLKPEHSRGLAQTETGECCIFTLPKSERANGAQPFARSINTLSKLKHSRGLAQTETGECCIFTLLKSERVNGAQPFARSINTLSKPEHSRGLAQTETGECCIFTLLKSERANGAQPFARSIYSFMEQKKRKEDIVVKKKVFAALFGALMLCTTVSAQDAQAEKPKGMGLAVMPGEMVIQNVVPGKEFDVLEKAGITLTISNNSDKARTYIIAPASPESLSLRNITGYSPLPDTKWLKLEKTEVEIAPFSQEQIKMFIAIPEGDKYFNQKWCTALSVSSKPAEGEKLALQVTPIYYIETHHKAEVTEAPAGNTGVVPGVIRLDKVPLGLNKKAAKFTIYNNDQKIHRYKVYVYMPSFDPYTRKVISSPNYFWIREGKWIRPLNKRIRVKPGELKEVELDINIPEERRNAKRLYEALIFVESDQGGISFVRIKMNTGRVQGK